MHITRVMHAAPVAIVCQRPSFYLKFLVKKRHNSKTIAFRVMSVVLHDNRQTKNEFSIFLTNNNNYDQILKILGFSVFKNNHKFYFLYYFKSKD